MEVSLGSGSAARQYLLDTTSLKDWRGVEVGSLLMLHDVTDQKKAQALLLEQQRALAILAERERLARELHDDLCQVLAFISTQGRAIEQALAERESGQAGAFLSRLIAAADEANVDLRESILSLRAPLGQQGLVPALQDYLQRYEQRYGLHTELVIPEGGLAGAFEPVAEVQVLRILQEGLTNTRKHAHAAVCRSPLPPWMERRGSACTTMGGGLIPRNSRPARAALGCNSCASGRKRLGAAWWCSPLRGRGPKLCCWFPLRLPFNRTAANGTHLASACRAARIAGLRQRDGLIQK